MKTNKTKKINKDNFNTSSIAIFFKAEKPARRADFVSKTEQYWFDEDERGQYIIRHADHWGRVQDCLWFITDKETHIYSAIYDRITKFVQEDLCGKCYFSEMLDLSGIEIAFENHTLESYKEKLIKDYDFIATPSYSNSGKTRYEDEISFIRKGHSILDDPYNPIVFRLDYNLLPKTHIILVDKFIGYEYERYLSGLEDHSEVWKNIIKRYKQEFVSRNLHYISESIPFRYAQNYEEDIFINPSNETIEDAGGSTLFTSVDEVIDSEPFVIIAAIKAMKCNEPSVNEMGLPTSPFTNLSEAPLGYVVGIDVDTNDNVFIVEKFPGHMHDVRVSNKEGVQLICFLPSKNNEEYRFFVCEAEEEKKGLLNNNLQKKVKSLSFRKDHLLNAINGLWEQITFIKKEYANKWIEGNLYPEPEWVNDTHIICPQCLKEISITEKDSEGNFIDECPHCRYNFIEDIKGESSVKNVTTKDGVVVKKRKCTYWLVEKRLNKEYEIALQNNNFEGL